MKGITQAGIARELGLSQALVSRVLNGDANRVAPLTARRIREIAVARGYAAKISRPARYLGLLHHAQSSRYEQRLVSGVLAEAQANGCMVIQQMFDGGAQAAEVPAHLSGWIVPGPLPPQLQTSSDSVVLLHYPDVTGRFDSVMEDNRAGMRTVLRALAELGHRKFGFFLLRPFGIHQAEIYSAFMQALMEMELPVPSAKWQQMPVRRESSLPETERLVRAYLAQFRDRRDVPTAVITGDVYALPMLRMAAEYGLRIPQDLSIVGYDDTPDCLEARPRLSSLAQPLEAMGQAAVRRLLYRMVHPEEVPHNLRIPMQFYQRESVAVPSR